MNALLTSDTIYYLKGALTLSATIIYLAHLAHVWNRLETAGQQLRYLTLLYAGVLATIRAANEVRYDADVDAFTFATILFGCLLLVTAIVSVAEAARGRREPRG